MRAKKIHIFTNFNIQIQQKYNTSYCHIKQDKQESPQLYVRTSSVSDLTVRSKSKKHSDTSQSKSFQTKKGISIDEMNTLLGGLQITHKLTFARFRIA